MWDEAKKIAQTEGSGVDVGSLIKKQAAWAEEIGDWRGAASMYRQTGQYDQAIAILGVNDDPSGASPTISS